MPLKFDEIKDNLTFDKLKSLFQKKTQQDENSSAVEKKSMPEDRESQNPLQRSFNDIKIVLEEGKYALFTKQFVVLLIIFLLVRYGTKSLTQSRQDIQNKIASWEIQQLNKDDYLSNKEHLLRLEPLFPDVSQKKEWMLVRLNDIFEKRKIPVTIDNSPTEETQSTYVVGKQSVTFKESFKNLGKFLADIENGDDFLRVNSLTITKLTDKERLGENTVTVQFATVFPQNKYAPTLFKDYTEQMAKIKQQQQPVATTDKTVSDTAASDTAASDTAVSDTSAADTEKDSL